MTDNRRQVLDMLAQGKITVDEAERLLALVDQPAAGESARDDASEAGKHSRKYLRVVVEPGSQNDEKEEAERVNIRVPMALIRAGVKLAALLPADATTKVNQKLKEKGIDVDVGALKAENLEGLVNAVADLEVDVQDGEKKVRIFIE